MTEHSTHDDLSTDDLSQDVLSLINQTNELIEDIRKLAGDADADPARMEQQMDKLSKNIEALRNHPAETWRQARDDIMGLASNLDGMQKTLTKEYEKARHDLTSLSQRARAEKSYAAYSPQTTDTTTEGEKE